MSSGSYFPPPVRAVEIPKPHGGGVRVLGVPTVADRIAQTVVARRLETKVEPIFHQDSYGYRPGRSALDAVAACRQRCWRRNWVIDLDIAKFFDSVPWDLIIKAVQANTDQPWVVLYVKRWLAAPLVLPDGRVQQRDRGTPQGSAASPVLANLFMHGPAVPGGPIRTVLRRRGRALRQREPGPTCAGSDRGQDGAGWVAAAPDQNQDRLLQGRREEG
jgi:group II intron reverse transcriptase/maturase